MPRWEERHQSGGVCDFDLNYRFYFRWLLNKVMQIVTIKGLPETVNQEYLKANLILDGDICVTDFDDKLYACIGALGGEPDEYYIPTVYTIANPILGSKMVYRKDWKGQKQNGVVIFNSDVDSIGFRCGSYTRGLYDLISQTATLLADNIVSINCAQINSRVQVFFTADGEGQATAGEAVLRMMYAGRPYQILRSDIVDQLTIQPVATASTSTNIMQLVELNNYIIAQFFQNIGVMSNDIRKKERLITAEVEEQNDTVQLTLTEMLTSWTKGFNEVNEFYGTEIEVTLNPILLREIADEFSNDSETEPEEETPATVEEDSMVETEEETVEEESEETTESVEEQDEAPEEVIEELEDVVEAVVEEIIGEGGAGDVEEPTDSEQVVSDNDAE
jgi:hypothetical protein